MKGLLDRVLGSLQRRRDELTAPQTPTKPSVPPEWIDQQVLKGNALEDEGDAQAALQVYREVILRAPESSRAHCNAGNALSLLRRTHEAEASYKEAIRLDGNNAAPHHNLGNLLMSTGNAADAAEAYRAAARLRPGWAEPVIGLAGALEESGSEAETEEAYRRALDIDPRHPGIALNFSKFLERQGRAADALACLEAQAARGNVAALRQKMGILRQLGEASAAVEVGRDLLARAPDDYEAWNAYLFTLGFAPEFSGERLLEEHRAFGAKIEAATPLMEGRSMRSPGSRLRIGYVSADFRRHPVYCFLLPLLRHHDRANFEIYCYYNHASSDAMTERLRERAEHWRDVVDMTDVDLARLIRRDGIDILVDLSGHTSGNRLGVFASRPAPVQGTWLGYLGTTGLSRMDFRFCDRFTDPVGTAERWHSETPIRLPDSQWCYEPPFELPSAGPLPRLKRGYWTFGSFNQTAKLSEPALEAWASVLASIGDSRLIVHGVDDLAAERRILSVLDRGGVAPSRVEIRRRVPIEAYFRAYGEVDVALDTFPYNGGTTTCDALAVGVPIAAVAGNASAARSAASLLEAVGLSDWIIDDARRMPELLHERLKDPRALVALRETLPARFRSSVLTDAARFAAGVEAAYCECWRRWGGETLSP